MTNGCGDPSCHDSLDSERQRLREKYLSLAPDSRHPDYHHAYPDHEQGVRIKVGDRSVEAGPNTLTVALNHDSLPERNNPFRCSHLLRDS